MEGSIHIGTSGWVYKHWNGHLYPKGLPAKRWLEHYATTFQTTEINSSFYRLPSAETIECWRETVGKNFIFCPKMSRFLSHMKKLRDPEEPLQRFFSVFEGMKAKMGPVLVQLPHMVSFNKGVVENFYRTLKFEFGNYRFVMEVRHLSWLEEESLNLMSMYNIGFVIAHSGVGFPYREVFTSDIIYVRFHGPGELYASAYDDKMLKSYATKFKKWMKEGYTIYAFFNNDIHGYAVDDALKLQKLTEEKKTKK